MAEPVSGGAGGSVPIIERVFGPSRPPGPIVRLPTWVNVVLVLLLFASCSAANPDDSARPVYGDPASSNDVRDLCRLLGAMAQKQGVDVDDVFAGQGDMSACREGLQQ